MKKNKYEIDMCNGTLMDKLISFAIPLMLSGILQLMFNAVDIIVVGRFSGSQSLAAVGSTTALINVFTNLFIGISLGANVLAARYYALEKSKEMSETVHTAIAFALISGVGMAVIGLLMAKPALELMGTPDDVIAKSTLYMRIYFCGMPFFMLYNYGAAILRAVGDTKRPLLFPAHIRCDQCPTESFSGDSVSPGCGRSWYCDCDLPVDLLHSGIAVPVLFGEQLSVPTRKIEYQVQLFETDL